MLEGLVIDGLPIMKKYTKITIYFWHKKTRIMYALLVIIRRYTAEYGSRRGRVVKATDLKSVSILERRFESYRLRRNRIIARRRLDLYWIDKIQIEFLKDLTFTWAVFMNPDFNHEFCLVAWSCGLMDKASDF